MARFQHYGFAHGVLRDAVLHDPILFLWASRLPDGVDKLKNIFRTCAHPSEPEIASDAIEIRVDERAPLYTVVVTLPPPEQMTEAYFAAAFIVVPNELVSEINRLNANLPARDALDRALKTLVASMSEAERAQLGFRVRYFTLEHSVNVLDGSAHTVLGGWRREKGGTSHVNFGAGPPADRDAFIDACKAVMREAASKSS
jgi:hypothetical protein